MSAHIGTFPLDTGSHHGGHGGGHGSFVDTMLRGFAWRTGSDVANSLFHHAPTLITITVGVVVIVLIARWLRAHSRS